MSEGMEPREQSAVQLGLAFVLGGSQASLFMILLATFFGSLTGFDEGGWWLLSIWWVLAIAFFIPFLTASVIWNIFKWKILGHHPNLEWSIVPIFIQKFLGRKDLYFRLFIWMGRLVGIIALSWGHQNVFSYIVSFFRQLTLFSIRGYV